MLVTALVFLVILSILVMVHEVGHFIAAKWFGIYVEEFGFGLPPRLWGKRIGETIYSINWLPIGGFVKLYGEEEEGSESDSQQPKANNKLKDRAFFRKPVTQRIIILTAGVTMNFLLGVVIVSYLFTQGVFVPVKRIHIEQIEKGSPAQLSGLEKGDIVDSINGKKLTEASEFVSETKTSVGREITIKVLRGASLIHNKEIDYSCGGCREIEIKLTPRENPPIKEEEVAPNTAWTLFKRSIQGFFGIKEKPLEEPKKEGPIGVVISTFETKKYPWYLAPITGTRESFILSWHLVGGIAGTLWKLVSFQSVSSDVAGPFGIAQMTGQAIKFGGNAVLELMGLLSFNLAVVNILPFPALDGGRLLFVLIEGATKRKVKVRFERVVHQIGMIILLTLILVVTINDIIKLFLQ